MSKTGLQGESVSRNRYSGFDMLLFDRYLGHRPTKGRFKNLCTTFRNRCCYSTTYQIVLIKIALQSSGRVELDFLGSVTKIALNVNPKGLK